MRKYLFVLVAFSALVVACNDDDGNDATDRGVGNQCVATADCPNEDAEAEGDTTEPVFVLQCLMEFKGGYCGLKDCQDHGDCPEGSKCVVEESVNYCFLVCDEKADCNVHRDGDADANCVGNAELIDGAKDIKVCVPPSA